jgi:HemY protein
LAAKFESEAHQVRRAMRIVEAAWLAHPHPDLADAYAHVRLGDSARQRLVRVETLAAKTPGDIEGALAIARAAIDATEFARAREALAGFTAMPTQRVAMLMAEIERTEHGDSGKARAWTLRAVRARHDPVWTADGYVSDRWRPVSPVTGRLDAFQWQTPVASLPSDKGATIEASPFEEAMLAAPTPRREQLAHEPVPVEPPREQAPELAPQPATQDNSPPAPEPSPAAPPQPESPPPAAPAPLFRARSDLGRPAPGKPPIAPVPAVIPILRAPDDPGIDDEAPVDEFTEKIGTPRAQAGGWRGFWSRWGG